jgi:glycerol-3-phosphate dehydrogenase
MDLDLIVIGGGTAGINPRRRLIIRGAIFDTMAI